MRKHNVTVGLDPGDVDRLDALAAALSQPGHPATRSDAIRVALARGLESMRPEFAAPAPAAE